MISIDDVSYGGGHYECPKCGVTVFGSVIHECDEQDLLAFEKLNKKEKISIMKREEVYKAIDSERDYQDKKWNVNTTASNGLHSPEEWLMYMEDYINEAKHILSRANVQEGYPKAMDNIRKVAAMAVCAMEQHGVNNREL